MLGHNKNELRKWESERDKVLVEIIVCPFFCKKVSIALCKRMEGASPCI